MFPWPLKFYLFFNKLNESLILNRWLQPAPGEIILDVGYGMGNQIEVLSKQDCTCYGFDVNKEHVGIAQRKGIPNAHFCISQAEYLLFEDNTFDKLTSYCVLEHMHDAELAVAEMHRVLKPGGMAVLSVDSFSLSGTTKQIKDIQAEMFFVNRYFDLSNLQQIFSRQGLKIQAYQFYVHSKLSALFYNIIIKNLYLKQKDGNNPLLKLKTFFV